MYVPVYHKVTTKACAAAQFALAYIDIKALKYPQTQYKYTSICIYIDVCAWTIRYLNKISQIPQQTDSTLL